MQPRLLTATLAAVVAALGLAGSARADSVTLYFDTATNATAITPTVNGHPTSQALVPGPYYFTQNQVPPNASFPPPTVTFCVQTDQFVSAGHQYTFDIKPLTAMPTIGTQIKADYITELWGRHYDTAWNNPAFATNPPSSSAYINSIAFQLAIWELAYDGTSTRDLAHNNFIAPQPPSGNSIYDQAYSTAQTWLNQLTGNTSYFTSRFAGYQLIGLTDPTDPKGNISNPQDQITMIPTSAVPAPPGVLMAGFGFLALFGRSRWSRRKAVAAV